MRPLGRSCLRAFLFSLRCLLACFSLFPPVPLSLCYFRAGASRIGAAAPALNGVLRRLALLLLTMSSVLTPRGVWGEWFLSVFFLSFYSVNQVREVIKVCCNPNWLIESIRALYGSRLTITKSDNHYWVLDQRM